MEQSHEDSEFERKGSQDMLSLKMKSTYDMYGMNNDSKMSVPAEFKKSIQGQFIPEDPHESDSDDKITTITAHVEQNKEFLEDKPIKIEKKSEGPKIDGKILEKQSIADRVYA